MPVTWGQPEWGQRWFLPPNPIRLWGYGPGSWVLVWAREGHPAVPFPGHCTRPVIIFPLQGGEKRELLWLGSGPGSGPAPSHCPGVLKAGSHYDGTAGKMLLLHPSWEGPGGCNLPLDVPNGAESRAQTLAELGAGGGWILVPAVPRAPLPPAALTSAQAGSSGGR